MKRDYSSEKEAKKRITGTAMWLLWIFILLFLAAMVRIALRSGSSEDLFTSLPSDDDAYQIAQNYVRPTIRSSNPQFARDFHCDKKSDSVYVVKLYVEADDNGQRIKTNFIVTLKYNGGTWSNVQNWLALSLVEH